MVKFLICFSILIYRYASIPCAINSDTYSLPELPQASHNKEIGSQNQFGEIYEVDQTFVDDFVKLNDKHKNKGLDSLVNPGTPKKYILKVMNNKHFPDLHYLMSLGVVSKAAKIQSELSTFEEKIVPEVYFCGSRTNKPFERSWEAFVLMEKGDENLGQYLMNFKPDENNQWESYLRLFIKIITPIARLESEGYQHCDIKPENFVVFKKTDNSNSINDINIRLIDFDGITKDDFCSVANDLFSPPEQIANFFLNIDLKPKPKKSDIYSVAALIFFIASHPTIGTGNDDNQNDLPNLPNNQDPNNALNGIQNSVIPSINYNKYRESLYNEKKFNDFNRTMNKVSTNKTIRNKNIINTYQNYVIENENKMINALAKEKSGILYRDVKMDNNSNQNVSEAYDHTNLFNLCIDYVFNCALEFYALHRPSVNEFLEKMQYLSQNLETISKLEVTEENFNAHCQFNYKTELITI